MIWKWEIPFIVTFLVKFLCCLLYGLVPVIAVGAVQLIQTDAFHAFTRVLLGKF